MNHNLVFPLLSTIALSAGYAQAQNAPTVVKMPVATAATPSASGDVAEKAGDLYLLPAGAGTKDGSSWKNAMSAAGGLQAGWDKLAPGQTLWLGNGDYGVAKLQLKSGGEKGKLKTLAGKDSGGAPVFKSDFDKNRPDKTGATFINLSETCPMAPIIGRLKTSPFKATAWASRRARAGTKACAFTTST